MRILNKIFVAALVLSHPGLFAQENKDSIIVLKKAEPKGIVIHGRVTDAASGKGLRGVRITYKTFSAAITDSSGLFNLKVPSASVSVMLEADGYQSKEVALRGRTQITASLYEDTYNSYFDNANLPFGPQMRSQLPNAVSSVQTNGAWSSTIETPSAYLQGKVAGLNAVRRSGTPNIGASLMLRGINSLYATNAPLVVVDGVIFDNNDYGGSIISNHYTDPLSTIDVRDIDNVTVLKDGSSIYGTKGANGVIIITTARAKELGTKIDLSVSGGYNFKPDYLPVMDAAEYRIFLSEMLKSKGLTDAAIQAMPYMKDDPSNPDYYKYHNNTNWQDEVFRNSYSRNIYLKVTGGDNIAKYALSLGYMGNEGITKGTDLNRYNMRFNGDLNLSKRLTATTNLSFTFNEQNLRDQGISEGTNPIFVALTKSPFLRVKDVSEKGVESPTIADKDTFNISNPVALTELGVGLNRSYRFFGSIGFNYQLTKNFMLATTLGITADKVRENFFIPRKGVTPDTLGTAVAYSRMGTNIKSLFSLFNDTRISYAKTFNHVHDLSAHLGVRYLHGKAEQDYGYGYNSAIDELVSVGNGLNALRRIGGEFGEASWLNNYLNVDYNYGDKYFFSFNMAMDGSSRFGKEVEDGISIGGNSYALLPSVSAAWLLSSEKFLENSSLNVFKLRASYGLSGNDDIGNYTARQTYVSQNLLGLQGLTRNGVGNEQLQWETVKKFNLGVDLALFDERLNMSLDFYRNKTDNMITYENAPAASGFDYAITNSAAMKTGGWEAAVNSRILNKAIFKWDLGFTVGRYNSRVSKLPQGSFETSFGPATYITMEGHDPNLFYGYKTTGVYSSDALAAGAGLSIRKPDGTLVPFKAGDVSFVDVNGDKVIDEKDRFVIGNPNPDFFGGISNRFVYKQFSLDALFTFSQGNDIYNYTRQQLESMSGFANQTKSVLNRWRNGGHVTEVPKATWGDPMGNNRFSDRWMEDGSYFRFRTVTLSYNLPFNGQFFKYAVVYLTGNNLFTLTDYMGYDPEFSPTESIYGKGVDNTLEPQARSVQVGVRIGL